MTGTTLSQIMVSYLPSIESLRAVTAFVEQGASFVPKKNIQDMLFKTTSSLLLGTQIGVVSKACQGFSQKVEVIKKPKETPVTARIQRVAELLIASSAAALFVVSQQAGDKLRSVIQLAGIATGLGIAFGQNKMESEAAKSRSAVRALEDTMAMARYIEELDPLEAKITEIKNLQVPYRIEIKYQENATYEEKKAKFIERLKEILEHLELSRSGWDDTEEFEGEKELKELLVKVENFYDGISQTHTLPDMESSGNKKPDIIFAERKAQYLGKIRSLLDVQEGGKQTPQKKKNAKDLRALQAVAENLKFGDEIPSSITFGKGDEIPSSFEYGGYGELPEYVFFQGDWLLIEYPSEENETKKKFASKSEEFESNRKVAVQFIQKLIQGVITASNEPALKTLNSLHKIKREVDSIDSLEKMPFSIPYECIDANGETYKQLIPVKYTSSELEGKKDDLSKMLDQLIAQEKNKIQTDLGAKSRKSGSHIEGVFTKRTWINVTVAALSALVVFAQSFSKVSFSEFTYSSNISMGSQILWSVGSLFISFLDKKEEKKTDPILQVYRKQAENVVAQRKKDYRKCQDYLQILKKEVSNPSRNKVVTEKETTTIPFPLPSIIDDNAHVTHLKIQGKGQPKFEAFKSEIEKYIAILDSLLAEKPDDEIVKKDLKKCNEYLETLNMQISDPSKSKVVTDKEMTTIPFPLPSIKIPNAHVTHLKIQGKGQPKFEALKSEVEKYIAILAPLERATVKEMVNQKIEANTDIRERAKQQALDNKLLTTALQLRRAQAVAFAFSGLLPILAKTFPKATYLAPLAKVASLASIGLVFMGKAVAPTKLRELGESAVSPVSLFVGIR